MRDFVKHNPGAPPRFFACEAAGLRWLSAVEGGAPCATVLDWDSTSITLERLPTTAPTVDAAREFGRRLAVTHDGGAAGFGAAPDGWLGPGFFGPLANPLPMTLTPHPTWGAFYAEERLTPMLDRAADRLGTDGSHVVERVAGRCRAGHFDDDDSPARLHGDLWSGNVMWTPAGGVLIDPAAQGGHRETDLAMLALFGCPHLDAILDGYRDVHPLRAGWPDRVALHQLYPLLAHVVLFGAGYARQTVAAARRALAS